MSPDDVRNAWALLASVIWIAPGIVGAKAFIGYSLARILSGPTW